MLTALFVTLALAVQGAGAPRVVGFGVTLSPDDIAQIGRGARSVLDADVWLIFATPTMACCQWSAQAYGLPSRSNQDIRHGRFVEMMAGGRDRAALTEPRTWIPRRESRSNEPIVREYAQVVLPDRPFEDVQQPTDENRPFQVGGEIDDESLVGLVRFLRSQVPDPRDSSNESAAAAVGDLVTGVPE